MKPFHELLSRVTSSPYHDQMMRFTKPLKDHFGINHFWYYRVTNSGLYTYVGTHSDWNEYCFENHLIDQFPILRHPDTQKSGISLMKNTTDGEYLKVQEEAKQKFSINFSLNISKKVKAGVEAFGFATECDNVKVDEHLINELPLLCYFTQVFREKHQKLFDIAFDSQVNISQYIGEKFYGDNKERILPDEKGVFLKKNGMATSQ